MLLHAPSLHHELPKFSDFIGDSILLGHNVHFDINFLYDAFIKLLNHPLRNDFVDTLKLSRILINDIESHCLEFLCEYFNIKNVHAHRASYDCYATIECFNKLKEHCMKNKIDINKKKPNPQSSANKKTSITRSFDINTIISKLNNSEKTHLLFEKHCCFTGELEKIGRKNAIQLVTYVGGDIDSSVTRKTNYLILGGFDNIKSIKDSKSAKLKRAELLIEKGQDLTILNEYEFYKLLLID